MKQRTQKTGQRECVCMCMETGKEMNNREKKQITGVRLFLFANKNDIT